MIKKSKTVGFTPLDQAIDFNRWYTDFQADGGLKQASAQAVRGRSSLTGFTFIELLIVTVIISVIIAAAIPRFRASYEQLQLNIDIGNLESLINAARELAVLEEKKLLLIYNEDGRFFSLLKENYENEQPDWIAYDYPIGKPYRLKERVGIHISSNEIVFYTDGTIDENIIWLNNNIGQKLGLMTDITGKVTRLEP